jgi:molybdate transport system permease protein
MMARAVPMRSLRTAPFGSALIWASAAALVLFLVLPIVALFVEVVPNGGAWSTINDPVVTDALRLSLITTAITVGITVVFGTPVAYLLARRQFRGAGLLDTLIDMPLVLPPAVAGIALLFTFGRSGLLGGPIEDAGVSVAFTTVAVVIAQVFVAAPFYVRAARSGFESVDPELERVSTTLGEGELRTFFRITVPLAAPALLGGIVMTWARALGEFGATIMFAGSLRGVTETIPLSIYNSLQDDLDAALVLSAVLVAVSFVVLLIFKALLRRSPLSPAAGGDRDV